MPTTTTLANELTVITEVVPGSRSVAIGILADTGPQDEPAEKAGLAHLTEHGFFLGTSNRDSREISQLVDESGGAVGAFTSRDYTCYYAHIMRGYTPFAWELLGDILLNSEFPEERILQERAIVLQELGIAHDKPISRLNDLLKRSIWRNHDLGRPVGGDPDSVARLTREDVIYFVGQNYMPDRMVIAAVGDIDHEATVQAVNDSFWTMLGTSKPRVENPCEFESSLLVQQRDNLSHAYFGMALPGKPYAHKQRYTYHAFNTLLGIGMSSRLLTKLRDELGIVYDVSSSYDSYRAAGTWVVEGVTAPENVETVLRCVKEQIEIIANDGVNEEDLHRINLQIKGQHQLASDSIHTRMSRLLTQELYLDRTVDESEVLAEIDEISSESLQGVAQELLANNQCGIGIIGPEGDGIDTHAIRDLFAEDLAPALVS